MQFATTEAPYTKTPLEDGKVQFNALPAPPPPGPAGPKYMLLLMACGYVFIQCAVLFAMAVGWFGVLLSALLTYFLGKFLSKRLDSFFANRLNKGRRMGGSFIVSQAGVEVGGRMLPKADIHQISIGNDLPAPSSLAQAHMTNDSRTWAGWSGGQKVVTQCKLPLFSGRS